MSVSDTAPPSLAEARQQVAQARRLNTTIWAAVDAITATRQAILDRYQQVMDSLCAAQIAGLPLSVLREASAGRLTLAPLEQAGYATVGQIARLTEAKLVALPGIGTTTARAILAARDAAVASVRQETSFRINLDPANRTATALLQELDRYTAVRAVAEPAWPELMNLVDRLDRELAGVKRLGRVRWWFTRSPDRADALAAAGRLKGYLDEAAASGVVPVCTEVMRRWHAPAADPWPGFEAHASDYYALLGEFVDTCTPSQAVQGYVTDDIVARVAAQELDASLRRVDLRGYQQFGAKYALAQRRIILGDEMGLGKTIQALAGLCHVASTAGGTPLPMLVVCPASVLLNWSREILTRTVLSHVVIHGPDRQDEVTAWLDQAAIGVTTYETLRTLELPADLHLSVLVVDEAHYVKNPDAARSRAVRHLTALSDYVWFLTGTPMENSVDEFAALVRYLQADVLPAETMPTGPVAFRRAVSGVYLRRNAVDVLAELPARLDQDAWVSLTAADREAHAAAVRTGNLMAIRQAAYVAPDSAKLERFAELVQEAEANGWKVVAYSYFREVLSRAHAASSGVCFPPLTGDVPPADRLRIVDEFSAHPGPALLLAQIKVGGVGLNIQAASVVILLEPQLTPAAEEQAIARSYRMGQVRPVHVYRILAERTVDETLVDLLARKTTDFDAYARRSEVAEATDEAVDVSFAGLGRQLVAAEQARDLR